MRRTVLLFLAALAFPAIASASLGGSVATVESDRVQMKSALVRIARNDTYTVHEILTPTGTTIREYYGSNGIVFGVAWQGPVPPDLRQLLGSYLDHYQNSIITARKGQRTRGIVMIDEADLVVHTGGHLRSFSGFAYVPALIPQGVNAAVVR